MPKVEFTPPLAGALGVDACKYYPEMRGQSSAPEDSKHLIASLVAHNKEIFRALSASPVHQPAAAPVHQQAADESQGTCKHARTQPQRSTANAFKPWRGHGDLTLKKTAPPPEHYPVRRALRHDMPPDKVDIKMLSLAISVGDVSDLTDARTRQYMAREVGKLQEKYPDMDWTSAKDLSKAGPLRNSLGALVQAVHSTSVLENEIVDEQQTNKKTRAHRFACMQVDPQSLQDYGNSLSAGPRLANHKARFLTQGVYKPVKVIK
jgi:hypothetical protein